MHELTELYYHTAQKMGLCPIAVPQVHGFKIIINGRPYYFRNGLVPMNDEASVSIACNKFITNKVLAKAGFPVPKATAYDLDEFEEDPALEQLDVSFPVVLKPTIDSSCGKDVSCNIQDKKSLIYLMKKMYEEYDGLSIEHFEHGLRSFRVLVLKSKVIAITERIPAQVTGDGKSSIMKLIDIQNKKRARVKDLPLHDYELNEETNILLKEKGIGVHYVPYAGETIKLRYVCNSSRGGTFFGVPVSDICKYNHDLLVDAAKTLNLYLVGFDFLCEDLSRPVNESRGCIIEANIGPDISIHENLKKGTQVCVTKPILKAFMKHYKKPWYYRFLINPNFYITCAFILCLYGILNYL